jgi:nucleoid-associated protein YgaU
MQKDMKIGMFVGLVLAAGLMVYVCTRPGLSPRARMLRQNNESLQSEQPPQSSEDSLSADSESNRKLVLAAQPEQISEPVQPNTLFRVRGPQVQPQPVNDIPDETGYMEGGYETRKFYVVRKGDTLSKISKMYYGTPNKWYKIYEANRNVLDDPDMLRPGTKLYIPN